MTICSDVRTAIESLRVSCYRVPTDLPEEDGTLGWESTTVVVVQVEAGDEWGIGFSYATRAVGTLIEDVLGPAIKGREATAIEGSYQAMLRAIRNFGRPGLCSMAISAVDIALWDLKSRLLGLPLAALLGAVREAVPAYGSGGFTSYTEGQLVKRLGQWVAAGFGMVKMKIGRDAARDVQRVQDARAAIGPQVELFVDANGGYSRKEALAQAERFAASDVRWFEEPVSSDDLEGLRLLRDRAPAGMAIAAGEYGYDPFYFRRMLEAGAVDVLQADATRCGGITGFLQVGPLCAARSLPLSAHTAPSIHVHPCCAVSPVRHVEYFHDHARLERLLFDGAAVPSEGLLRPDYSRPGLGLELKYADAEEYRI